MPNEPGLPGLLMTPTISKVQSALPSLRVPGCWIVTLSPTFQPYRCTSLSRKMTPVRVLAMRLDGLGRDDVFVPHLEEGARLGRHHHHVVLGVLDTSPPKNCVHATCVTRGSSPDALRISQRQRNTEAGIDQQPIELRALRRLIERGIDAVENRRTAGSRR